MLFLIKRDKNDGEKELFKKQRWKALDLLIIFLSIDIFLIVLNYVARENMGLYAFINEFYVYIMYIFICFLLIILFEVRIKQGIKLLGFEKTNYKKNIFLGIITGCIGFIMVNYVVIHYMNVILGNPHNNLAYPIEELRKQRSLSGYFFFYFTVLLMGPFIEEVIYRGLLYSPYRRKFNSYYTAILITSVFFAVSHFGINTIPNFFVGITFCLLYEKTESLIATIIAHSSYNFLSIVSVFLA